MLDRRRLFVGAARRSRSFIRALLMRLHKSRAGRRPKRICDVPDNRDCVSDRVGTEATQRARLGLAPPRSLIEIVRALFVSVAMRCFVLFACVSLALAATVPIEGSPHGRLERRRPGRKVRLSHDDLD